MTAMGEKLLRSMGEAVAYAKSEARPEDYRVHAVSVDVREIRKKLKMTQKRFAQEFGFSLDTLRHWEQHRRTPEGPARAYLLVISQNPDAVRAALQSAAQSSPPPPPPKGVPAASV